jgi:hypothetical protein
MDITFNGTGNTSGSSGDVDSDSDIDIIDALLIAQYYVNLIDSFPSCATPAPTNVSTSVTTDPPYTGDPDPSMTPTAPQM